jgi:hypothetical protein
MGPDWSSIAYTTRGPRGVSEARSDSASDPKKPLPKFSLPRRLPHGITQGEVGVPVVEACRQAGICFRTATICSTEERFFLTANLPSTGQILPETNSQSVLRIGEPIKGLIISVCRPQFNWASTYFGMLYQHLDMHFQ